MAGYGSGLSEIAASSARTGAQLYAPEYAGQMQKATSEYGGQLATAQSNFQAALADWQKSMTQTTTTERDYGQGYGTTEGGYTPTGVKMGSKYYGKSYSSYDDYIKSGDYMWNRR